MWESFEILPDATHWNNYYCDGEIGVEAAITKHAKLRTYIDDQYYSIPAKGRLKNDSKLVGALAYTF